MTAPAPVPDGTTPPAEAVEAVMEALGCSGTATAWADREEARRVVVCAAHRDEWNAQGCPVAVSVAVAVVAALDLPKRDREASAKALEEAAQRWTWGKWSDVMLPAPKPGAIPALDYGQRAGDWLRSCASALREGRES